MVRGKFVALTFVNKEGDWKAIALQLVGSQERLADRHEGRDNKQLCHSERSRGISHC